MAFEQTVQDIKNNGQSICSSSAESPDMSSDRMQEIINKVLAAPGGIKLVSFLLENKVAPIFTKDNGIDFAQFRTNVALKDGKTSIIPGASYIAINPLASDDEIIGMIFHEGRHAQQYNAGIGLPDKIISPQHMAIHKRFLEADAQAEAVIQLLKMKLKGQPTFFYAARKDGYENMFDVALAGYEKDPTSLDDGRLKRMAFDAWFTPGLKNAYDQSSLQTTYPQFIKQLGNSPEHGFAKTPITVEDLEKFGAVSEEKFNYLKLPGFKPLSDPYYTEGFSSSNHTLLLAMTKTWVESFQTSAPAKTATPKPGG